MYMRGEEIEVWNRVGAGIITSSCDDDRLFEPCTVAWRDLRCVVCVHGGRTEKGLWVKGAGCRPVHTCR